MKYNTVFLDAGHGGIKDGKYTTAPSKMFTHTKPFNSNGNVVFYEGVKNRIYMNRLAEKLIQSKVNVVKVYDQEEDTSLQSRVLIADTYNKWVSKGIYVSEHSNATSSGKARGFTAFTSRGNTLSDALSQSLLEEYSKRFTGTRILTEKTDGDWDYEADFYVIKNTDMPSVLIENLFFDNYQDACQLYDATYMEAYTDLLHDWIIESLRKLN
jgi:N-acetylmuramoyl-L-alanine amidase